MESMDSSPNYMDSKREISLEGGSECDDTISVTSSTCGSIVNGPYDQKLNNGIKHKSSNKKTQKNFGTVRSFRRRAKPRIIKSDDESLPISPYSSPRYLKPTTSSQGKSTHSQTSSQQSESPLDGSGRNFPHPKMASSIRNVRILIRKTSFRPKRGSLSYPTKVIENAAVNRATYSSTIKDSKFPEAMELHSREAESVKSSALKVCRYHHCSLHGHCRGSHDPEPPLKRFLSKRRRALKKQKSILLRSDSRIRAKNISEKSKIVPVVVEPLDQERSSDGLAFSGDEHYNEKVQPFGDGIEDIRDAFLVELAFGETSFPERSYQENLGILRKYSSSELDFGGASFGRNGRCSCHHRDDVSTDVLATSSPAHFKKPNEASSKDCPETPDVLKEVSEKTTSLTSSSYGQTCSSDGNSEVDLELRNESTTSGDESKANEVVQVEDSEANSPPVLTGTKLQFSKPRHISMWHLIQQHMSSNVPPEATNQPVQGTANGAESTAEETSASSRADPDVGGTNGNSETQEIETRKLLAIKLVREAIEKILLPEVQDQTSDDQSVTSESTPRPEITEKNPSIECGQESSAGTDADAGEADLSSNLKEESVATDECDASSHEIKETEKLQVVRKSEKKAPKHWSNLKKWILLQRFIRELEKVRKFNPRKPRHLPLNPDPETEKVNLRHQAVDGRKSAEEWMLDYALRQAVSELAPTQKRKVSLLVKAFETVVPQQENSPQAQFRSPRVRGVGKNGFNVDEPVGNDASVRILRSMRQETGVKILQETERVCELKDSLVKLKGSNGDKVDELMDEGVNKNKVKVGCVAENLTVEPTTLAVSEGKANESSQDDQMDRKNHIKMWHMIYHHIVSGIAEKVGKQLLDGSEDDESEENEDPSEETHASNNLRGGLTKSNALKLVKEAVDEILLPDIQDDSSDTQPVTSESVQDEGEEKESARGESGVIKHKNWRKLKRLMLLKRSLKALEKARKSKPSVPESAPDPKAEKVELRQQMMDERKKAEQWMLDYAVQHIVTKLTPARKRRVSMLVEAFEAVVPLPEI